MNKLIPIFAAAIFLQACNEPAKPYFEGGLKPAEPSLPVFSITSGSIQIYVTNTRYKVQRTSGMYEACTPFSREEVQDLAKAATSALAYEEELNNLARKDFCTNQCLEH